MKATVETIREYLALLEETAGRIESVTGDHEGVHCIQIEELLK